MLNFKNVKKQFGKTYFRNFKNRSYRSLEKHLMKIQDNYFKNCNKNSKTFRKYKDILNNLKN